MWLWLALHRCYLEVGALQCIGGFDTIAIKFVAYNPEQASFLLTCSILTSEFYFVERDKLIMKDPMVRWTIALSLGWPPRKSDTLRCYFLIDLIMGITEDHRHYSILTWLYNLDIWPQTDPILSVFELFLFQSQTWSWYSWLIQNYRYSCFRTQLWN